MDLESNHDIEAALHRVGEELAFDKCLFSVVVIGGAALNLLGIVDRATSDVDIVAFANHVKGIPVEELSPPTRPMPQELQSAVEAVAEEMYLDPEWMNIGPSLQWLQGLPPGLGKRVSWRHYGPSDVPALGLNVGLVSRYDLIFFKLYAAVDDAYTGSVHYKDLVALNPTSDELTAAANWIRPQNASPEFHSILGELINHLLRDLTS